MLVPDCVSSFPSVTPVACAEMVTGVGADRHWISGMNWYHRLERRYVEYGSSLEATRAFGVFRALYDLVYNMNLAHLSPEVETLFERLDDAGARTACTPFLIYRGRHRHQVSLEGLMRRAVDATRLKFRHHTWGPTELFYGDLYASREVPCKSTSIPGNRDGYSACCAAELVKEDALRLPPLLAARQRQLLPPPRAGGERRVDRQGRPLLRARWSRRRAGSTSFLADHALILLADHAQTDVHRGLPLAELLGREWSVLQPSEDRPELAQLAVSPTGRAAHVYLLPGEGERAEPRGGARRGWPRSRASTWSAGSSEPTARRCDATRARDAAGGRRVGGGRARRRGGCASGPATRSPTCAAAAGRSRATSAALEATVEDGRLRSETYPDPLARVWSALTAPARRRLRRLARARLRGGRLGRRQPRRRRQPRLPARAATRSARCSSSAAGRTSPDEREQWTLRDVAPAVLRALRPMRTRRAAPASCSPRSLLCAARRRRRAARRRRRRERIGATEATARRRPRPEGRRGAPRARRASPRARASIDGNWEVGYFADGEEVALVIVDPASGEVRESWTGYQVAWKMARGYSGAFGHKLNAPYVFLPLCAIFLLGLLDWRRPRRVANLDLLVLLGFGVSHFFFNRAEIGVSVPLAYPLLALPARPRPLDRLARAGARGCGRSGRPPGC